MAMPNSWGYATIEHIPEHTPLEWAQYNYQRGVATSRLINLAQAIASTAESSNYRRGHTTEYWRQAAQAARALELIGGKNHGTTNR